MTTQGKMKQSARTAKGKIKEAIGRATGDRRMTAEGQTEQMTARVKHAAEKGAMTLRHGSRAAKGKAKEILGSATGNRRMKAEGKLEKTFARTSEKFNK